MKSLTTLIKLASQKVNHQRARLAEYQKKEIELKNAIEALKSNIRLEAERAREDSYLAAMYGEFAQKEEQRIDALEDNLEENAKHITREQDRLSILFKEQKVLEVYQAQQKEKQLQQEALELQKELDEIATRIKAG